MANDAKGGISLRQVNTAPCALCRLVLAECTPLLGDEHNLPWYQYIGVFDLRVERGKLRQADPEPLGYKEHGVSGSYYVSPAMVMTMMVIMIMVMARMMPVMVSPWDDDYFSHYDHVGVPDLRIGPYKHFKGHSELPGDAEHCVPRLNYVLCAFSGAFRHIIVRLPVWTPVWPPRWTIIVARQAYSAFLSYPPQDPHLFRLAPRDPLKHCFLAGL